LGPVSIATGGPKSGYSGFNVAENLALSMDLEAQAEELISRIKRNQATDLRDDWKVTILKSNLAALQGCVIVVLQGCVIVVLQGCVIVVL
jgi:hypothetical protein